MSTKAKTAKPELAKSANETQIGGDHYKGSGYEPWDFSTNNNLTMLQGNAIKYVARFRKKNGEQDLEKVGHYIQKMKEVFPKGKSKNVHFGELMKFKDANNLSGEEIELVELLCNFRNVETLERAELLLEKVAADFKVEPKKKAS